MRDLLAMHSKISERREQKWPQSSLQCALCQSQQTFTKPFAGVHFTHNPFFDLCRSIHTFFGGKRWRFAFPWHGWKIRADIIIGLLFFFPCCSCREYQMYVRYQFNANSSSGIHSFNERTIVTDTSWVYLAAIVFMVLLDRFIRCICRRYLFVPSLFCNFHQS